MKSKFEKLSVAGDLGTVVADECSHLKYLPIVAVIVPVKPTPEQTVAISHLTFPKELMLAVTARQLSDSKMAIKVLLQGLEEDMDFTGLMTFCTHDPQTHQNPLGKIDMTIFT